jgi:1D-myo-inositol-tetrakisphosphate 5-kinase/inositol-polyphosphate multikinase
MDERGIREVAFYEAIQASTKRSLFDTYCRIFGPKDLHNPTKYASSTLLNISKWLGISVQEQHSDSCCDPETISMEIKLLHRLALFTAEYFGLVDVDHKNDSNCQTSTSGFDRKCQSCCYGTTYTSYILAHNLTINFSKPSVLDIKMGVETFEPDAPEDKKIREINKYELQHEMGFRIVAIRIYDPTNVQASNDGYIYFPKSFGRSLTSREQVKHAMITFFGGEENEKLQSREVLENRSHSIKKILSKLKLIRKWFQENDIFSFTASSLLMMYESNDNASQPGGADVKMIDFGRVRRRKGGDPGYHQGLRMLMSILEEILRDEFRSEDYDYVP